MTNGMFISATVKDVTNEVTIINTSEYVDTEEDFLHLLIALLSDFEQRGGHIMGLVDAYYYKKQLRGKK